MATQMQLEVLFERKSQGRPDNNICICPLFSTHPRGFDSSRVPSHSGQPGRGEGGVGWVQLELTDA